MDSVWGTIGVAAISSGSALIASYLTNKATERRLDRQVELEKQREIQKTKLAKAEEIYLSLHNFKKMLFAVQVDWVSLARQELTISELNKKAAERKSEDIAFLQAKLGIYFPSLLLDFEESRELLNPANDCYFKMLKWKQPTKELRESYVNIILDAGLKFDKRIDELLHELSNQVNGSQK